MIDHPENSAEYKGLTVNAGVENLPSVNPYATFRRKKTVLTPEEYFEGIRRGDMTILSQAVTLVESKPATRFAWVSPVCRVPANRPSLRP